MVIKMVIEEIYIVVKAYPEKSKSYGSAICTAGITSKKEWVRIYPIDLNFYRLNEGLLKKWNKIQADLKPSNEKLNRKESMKINEKSIQLLDGSLADTSDENTWNKRNNIILPLLNKSVEELEDLKKNENISIGLIKPKQYTFYLKKEIKDITIHESKSYQKTLTGEKIIIPDEIPNAFAYRFSCNIPNCKGHDMICEDWEIRESFREWRKRYNFDELKNKLIEKYDIWMKERDLYFVIGTTNPYNKFVIIGLYYPPKRKDKEIISFFGKPN